MSLNYNKREGDQLHAEEWNELVQEVQGKQTRLNVVDALDSDSSTDVLSAKQGKVLSNRIVNATNTINSVEDIVKTLPVGYFYGTYDVEENLPTEITEKGYAYVGTGNPYVIYTYDVETGWTVTDNKYSTPALETDLSTESQTKAPTTKAVKEGIEAIDVTLARSSEDDNELTKVQKYNASVNINDRGADIVPITNEVKSLGYKILNPNQSFAEQVENVIENDVVVTDNSNTIFEIRDEFDLESGSVTIPTNCTLKFNGGKIKNGTISATNITIDAVGKVFDNCTFDKDSKFVNKILHLSWFNNDDEDCADSIQSLIGLNVPEVYLDLSKVKFSHPILTPTDQYRTRKQIYGLSGGLRNSTRTTIVPTNDYSDAGYERSAFIFADVEDGKMISFDIHHLNFEFSYKVNYAFYFKSLFTKSISYCSFGEIPIAAIKISGGEECYIQHNYFSLCGCNLICTNFGVVEDDILNSFGILGNADGSYPTAYLHYNYNYSAKTNYGVIGKFGVMADISNNSIGYTSNYALYLINKQIQVTKNYFEGDGRTNFWIDKSGLHDSVEDGRPWYIKVDMTATKLASTPTRYYTYDQETETYNKCNANSVFDPNIDYYIDNNWGIEVSDGRKVRGFIVLSNCVGTISNNVLSCNHTRTKQSDRYISNNKTLNGVDVIYILCNCKYNITGDFVGPGAGVDSGIPRYYCMAGASIGSPFPGFNTNKSNITIDILPEVYYNTDWLKYNSPILSNDGLKVVLNSATVRADGYLTKATNLNAAPTSAVNLSEIAPYYDTEDGIDYYKSNNLTYIIDFNVSDLKISQLVTFYIKNSSNSAITYHIPISYSGNGTTLSNFPITVMPKVGSASSPIALQAGEIAKYSILLSPAQIYLVSQYIKYIGISPTVVSGDGLCVSQLFVSDVNQRPTLVKKYPKNYSVHGIKNIGDRDDVPLLASYNKGFLYYAEDLDKPIFWNGIYWTDANGEAIGLQVSNNSVLIGAAANSTATVDVYYSGTTPPTISILNSDDTPCTWLTGTPDPFTGNTLTLTATANTDSNPRGCKVVITLGSEEKIINVVQNYSTT